MAVWKPRWSAKGLDLEVGFGGSGRDESERRRGERVGALGRVGEGVEDDELREDWRGDC